MLILLYCRYCKWRLLYLSNTLNLSTKNLQEVFTKCLLNKNNSSNESWFETFVECLYWQNFWKYRLFDNCKIELKKIDITFYSIQNIQIFCTTLVELRANFCVITPRNRCSKSSALFHMPFTLKLFTPLFNCCMTLPMYLLL